MKGTGRIRKPRWGRCNKGKAKSVSEQLVYYHHEIQMTICIRTFFGTNNKDNVSQANIEAIDIIDAKGVATEIHRAPQVNLAERRHNMS
jgi:hypothetical protein